MDARKAILNSKYFYLLVSLVLFFIINPFLSTDHISNFIICIFFLFIIIISVQVISYNFYVNLGTLIIAALSFASYWYLIWINNAEFAYAGHFLLNLIFLSLITFSVISSVQKHKQITADTLFGAICGYLLIGFTWAFIFLLIGTLDPNSFSIHTGHEHIRARIDHFIYFSFSTLTTTGYGDILPTKSVARTFAWMEACIGQIYLAVWISQLVGLRLLQEEQKKML